MRPSDKLLVLAAGQGKRMGPRTSDRPKALLEAPLGETIISRMLKQFRSSGVRSFTIVIGFEYKRVIEEVKKSCSDFIEEIAFVENHSFATDTNILSLSLGIQDKDEPFILVEGDLLLSDGAVKKIVNAAHEPKSYWFTRGAFEPGMYGGILSAGPDEIVTDIKLVKEYDEKYSLYCKLLGIMTIGPNEIGLFSNLLKKGIQQTVSQYFLEPWINNLKDLPCKNFELDHSQVFTFNTEPEYLTAIQNIDSQNGDHTHIELVEVSTLKHIEGYSSERVEWLKNKIIEEGIWTQPLKIDLDNHMVLDGQHRFEVAKELGLKVVPCQKFKYHDVEIWSLRDDEDVSHDRVIEKTLAGDIYPYKTVKHRFTNVVDKCEFTINDLGVKK